MPVVTCPTCAMKLTVDADDLGHKVQCPGCQGAFTADDGSKPADEKKQPYSYRRDRDDDRDDDDRPRRRRDADEDDPDAGYRPRSRRRDYGNRDYEERYGTRPQTGMGTTSMVLGIVSLPLILMFPYAVPITSLLGIIFGCIALKTEGRKQAITGIICSVIAIVLAVLLVAAVVVWIVLLSSAATTPSRFSPSPATFRGSGRF